LPEIIQDIGAYAGLASVVGLAVLSALYFSQARDVKRLREWAGRAPERAEQEAAAAPGAVVAQPQAAARPGAPPVPGRAAAAAAGARPAAATAPVAATPAAATAAAQAAPAAKGVQAAPAGEAAAAGEGTGASAAPAQAGANSQGPTQAPPKPAVPVPAGATAGPSASSADAAAPPAQPARPAAPATPAGQRPGAPPVPPAGARGPGRPGGPPRPMPQSTAVIPPSRTEPWYRRLIARPLYLVLAIAGVLIVGGAAVFGVTQLTSDDGGGAAGGAERPIAESPQAGGEGEGGERQQRRGGAVNPANVTVAVLNGTTVPGLAASLGDQLEEAGFQEGTIADYSPNQQLAESVVQYAPGHERQAAAVGRRIGISQREAANPTSQELAGNAPVIVLVGADKSP
jgi:LytR cell envelope-related transcriptional attenuator